MNNNSKVLTYLGILIAVNTAVWERVKDKWWMIIFINILTVVFCIALSFVEKLVTTSNRKWIDRIVYIFSKNDYGYIVNQKNIEYKILSEHEAEYSLLADICVKKPEDDFHYNGRYVWDQEDAININIHDENNYTYMTSENLKWSNVDIIPNKIPKRGTKYSLGFTLKNLKISKLSKRSFLSCKVVEKIEHLKMVAYVDPSLNPDKTAILEIQNSLGIKIAKDEQVVYDERTHTYSKTLSYPRKGRKYIIRWKYKKTN